VLVGGSSLGAFARPDRDAESSGTGTAGTGSAGSGGFEAWSSGVSGDGSLESSGRLVPLEPPGEPSRPPWSSTLVSSLLEWSSGVERPSPVPDPE
jgi:hypothetical protein